MTGGEPQFLELVPHVGIHSSTEVAREVRGADEAEDVGEILKSGGRGHARGELHLDEPGKSPVMRKSTFTLLRPAPSPASELLLAVLGVRLVSGGRGRGRCASNPGL